MSVSQNVGGKGGGFGITSSVVATTVGVATLPNTGGNNTVSFLAVAAITVGVLALVSQVGLFIYKRIAR